MKSIDFYKYFSANPDGASLTATHSGSETVTAKAFKDGRIVVYFANLGSTEYITINTPFAFEVIDAYLRVENGENVGSKTLTVYNGSSAVSSALSMATDKGIARATTIDSTYAEFAADDNDLKLVSSAHADGDATVTLVIQPS